MHIYESPMSTGNPKKLTLRIMVQLYLFIDAYCQLFF